MMEKKTILIMSNTGQHTRKKYFFPTGPRDNFIKNKTHGISYDISTRLNWPRSLIFLKFYNFLNNLPNDLSPIGTKTLTLFQ